MTPDTPLDIQWFAYVLAANGILDDENAQLLREQLNNTSDLGEYANSVTQQLCENLPEDQQQDVVDQMQRFVDYACQQAETGNPPDLSSAEEEDGEGNSESPAAEETLHYDAQGVENGAVQGYEDLPSFSDTASLSDEEVAQRMIFMLTCLRTLHCSDLHISAGAPPFVRRQLQVERLDSYIITPEDAKRLNFALLPPEKREQLLKNQDLSMALEIGSDRFRVCLMEQKQGYSGSYRLVPDHICSLEELGFLDKDVIFVKRLLDYNNGLVLVTGPIGAGKTTTLAAMVNIVNEKRQDHIISVEDPIEILQISKNCQVSQREVGRDTESYRRALKAALREDPDVIVIGEMHDLETIENAITAAETGHLVIGTLHTSNAPNTMNRILDVFPPSQQPQIRAMTAGSLRGVICQKLIPDGFGGVTLIYEIMLNTMGVANIINEGKTFRLQSTMITSNKQGMCTFDQCILEKYSRNLITREAALAEMTDATIITQLNSLWAQRESAAQAAAKKRR